MVSKPKLFQEHETHKKHKNPKPVQPEAKQRRLWGTEKKRTEFDGIFVNFIQKYREIVIFP